MNRRKFFNTVSASLLFSQAVFERIEAATRQIIGVPPQEAAKIESFWREIQQSFSVSRSVINLNNAGVCASPRIVTEAVVGFTWEQEKVPSYTAFTTFPPRLETIRSKLARLFGCDANEIAIVRNTTEALQTVLLGVNLKKGDEVFEELSIKTLKSKGYYDFHEAIRPVFIFSINTNATEKKIQYGKMFLCHLIVSLITMALIVTFHTKKAR